jgi:NADH-ubiquinone oxidoreductase chain 6
MTYLFKLNESFASGIPDNILNWLSIASIICGILVIISRNPIVSVLFLIGLFLTIATYLMTLGIFFIGLSYLLVYVGAVSILFLFILMLINVRVSELVTDNNNTIPLSVITITIFTVVFNDKIPSSPSLSPSYFNILSALSMQSNNALPYTEDSTVNFATSHIWDATLAEVSHISSIGNILYTSYPMLLILTSVILLLAMVGAIIITIKQ